MILDKIQVEIVNQGIDWPNIIAMFISVLLAGLIAFISSLYLGKKEYQKQQNYNYWADIFKCINVAIKATFEYQRNSLNLMKAITYDKNIDSKLLEFNIQSDLEAFLFTINDINQLARRVTQKEDSLNFFNTFCKYERDVSEYSEKIFNILLKLSALDKENTKDWEKLILEYHEIEIKNIQMQANDLINIAIVEMKKYS